MIQLNTSGSKRTLSQRSSLTAQKEKETFKEVKHDILKENIVSTSIAQQNQDPPMYEMPSSMDHTNKGKPLEQENTINIFLQYCVKLLNDPSSIKVL
jgi:hypothetical protein